VDHRDVGRLTLSNHPARKTILCIDDSDSMLGYQRALLERRGFAVVTAASARQGLEIAVACAVAAVVLDYHMPEMNGHEVATEIKRLRPQLPIVMVSSDEWIPEHTLKMVDAFVSKNEAHSCLVPAITRICGENSPADNLFQIATEEKDLPISSEEWKRVRNGSTQF
jgi:CheY-like chemotaxis protein